MAHLGDCFFQVPMMLQNKSPIPGSLSGPIEIRLNHAHSRSVNDVVRFVAVEGRARRANYVRRA